MKYRLGFFSIILCFLVFYSPSLLHSVELSKEQIEMLKKTLEEKYKSEEPIVGQKITTPEVVTPRDVDEKTVIEEDEEAKEEEAEEEETEEEEIKDEAELERETSFATTTRSPIQKVESQEEAELGKVRKAFADFVKESKPLTVPMDIQQFGYDLFAGVPSTFAPATEIPVTSNYVIGPGDEALIYLYGARQERLTLTVTREGTLSFLDEGPVYVAGLTFSKMVSLIEKLVRQKMIGVTSYITMGRLRSIRVFVLGDVERPGSYTVSGLATLSHSLFVSGGIKKIGSLRNIRLLRSGKKVAELDLYDFLLKGDTSKDVRLLPGDVIFAPPIGDTVGIAGEVIRPAIYELKGKTSVGQLVKLAGGLRPTAYKGLAQIERIDKDGNRIVVDINLEDGVSGIPVQKGDLIKIFSILDIEKKVVFIAGNVRRPGKRAFNEGMRVLDIIPDNEELLPETYYGYGLIERETGKNREPGYIRFHLGKALAGDESANLELESRDKIYIFNRRHFLHAPTVEVEGMVHNPGIYDLKKGMRLIDLILAGGITRDTYMEKAQFFRTDRETKEVTLLKINLREALDRNPEHNLPLEDLDRLVVSSIWEYKTKDTVSISGEVNKPGIYTLAANATIYDLLISGGYFTEKAYRIRAELTRFEVVDGKKRESEHIKIDLEKVARKNPQANIALKTYDHLIVKSIENWQPATMVAITGEVRFPGKYPIEEGERLADLIERAGGFTGKAFLFGAKFTRKSIAEYQEKRFNEMADILERDVLRMSASPAKLGETTEIGQKKLTLQSLKELVLKLREIKHEGRLVINLMEPDKLRESEFNLISRDGDTLHIPKRPDFVVVMGEVYNSNAFIYNSKLSVKAYIELAGGFTKLAQKGDVYVIKANGSVFPTDGGFFSKKIEMGAGDVIIAPEKIERYSKMQMTKDISKILYELAITVAALSTVGVF